jgi:alkylation response protein AidB-like acyl-CoA dehydrogenase
MLDETHEAIRKSVRDFTDREIVPIVHDLDNAERPVPDELIAKIAKLGYLGIIFPEENGGLGLDAVAMAVVTEELARGWLAAASIVTRAIIAGTLVSAHGTPEQKRTLLPRLCSGEVLSAAAFTEPDAGSDTAAIALRASREGDAYVLRGSKTWCTFADRARLLTILCRTDPESSRQKGLSILLVEKEPGFAGALAGEPIPTIGYKGVTSFSLAFDGLRVPSSSLLGEVEGQGFGQLMATYEYARIQTAARAVGVAQAALEAAIRYAKERIQFGVPIAEHQVIRHKLAKMASEVQAARQLTWFAARAKDRGRRCDLEAGCAKAFASEMAERVTSEALQVFGGYGYSREFPVQRFWRDARVFKIFEGTIEIQYEVIAKRLLDGTGMM